MTPPCGETRFPIAEARRILGRAAMKIGYDRKTAAAAVWAAFWLERRGAQGVARLLAYLPMAAARPFASLRPRRHERFRLAGACPFLLAPVACAIWARNDAVRGIGLCAPGAPLFLAPFAAELARDRTGEAVRLNHGGASCVASETGLRIEGAGLSLEAGVDLDDESLLFLERVPNALPESRRPLREVALPGALLLADGSLDLSRALRSP